MDSQTGRKIALERDPGGRIRKYRSRKRWLGYVQDTIKIGIKGRRTKATER
jgi:hypothetical protein